jgi:hypothetical protein
MLMFRPLSFDCRGAYDKRPRRRPGPVDRLFSALTRDQHCVELAPLGQFDRHNVP